MTQQRMSVLPADAVHLPELTATPTEIARSWQRDEPLIALIASKSNSTWSRWSIVAPATGDRLILDGEEAMADLRTAMDARSETSLLPNWIGFIGYELGHVIEPCTASLPANSWPLVDLMWCDKALVHDNETDSWFSIGGIEPPILHSTQDDRFSCGVLQDAGGDDAFTRAVQRTIEYIHAGDIFQANMTRRFHASVSGNIRDMALSMLESPGGWFGAWIEFQREGRYLMSMSPELFLHVDGESREVITRPMKGTRPDYEDPQSLLTSEKDAAELHMIVDLMRNDLGRVCEFGSIEVRDARLIEHHPTVWQCVGEVRGTLRSDITTCDLLEATFPAGSVTGAPKIRAMQIINELESTPRGPYCGAVGILGQSVMLNVAIRTALFQGSTDSACFNGTMEYSTGCGIVAESDPFLELEESEVKTHILDTLM